MMTVTPSPQSVVVPDFQHYRRSQIAHLRPYIPGEPWELLDRVSISQADLDAGSPKDGDMIARNPANHDDQWLVAADYFAANFEPAAAPAPSSLAGGAATWEALDENGSAELRINGRRITTFPSYGGAEEAAGRINAALSPEAPARGEAAIWAKVEEKARRYARCYPEASDGRNTFVMFAEWAASEALTPRHEAPASEGAS